jgi:hypothetical protein
MRVLVVVLALLAALKIGTQQYILATAKSEIIVAAYKERATGACERAAKLQRLEPKAGWARPSEVRLVIGKASLDVQMWQLDHALWQARFKNPYLFLIFSGEPQKLYCEFDVVQGAASVFRM